MANWNQPICEVDWIDQHSEWQQLGNEAEQLVSIRMPVRLAEPQVETCAYCGKPTIFGAYVRADPKSVLYPASDD